VKDKRMDKPAERTRSQRFGWSLERLLDLLVKLSVPIGTLAAALIAHNFQVESAVRSTLNQREQSESELRASMFGHLIGTIAGAEADGGGVPAEREALLVELLALNFHEHFEFKPLMLHADHRLLHDAKMKNEERDQARGALRSVARRVIDRQIVMLGRDAEIRCADGYPAPPTVSFVLFDGEDQAALAEAARYEMPAPPHRHVGAFSRMPGATASQVFRAVSPDCNNRFDLAFFDPDWQSQTIKVQVNQPEKEWKLDFTASRFDFPLSDNTLLADGNRFAVYIYEMSEVAHVNAIKIQLLWFPKDYFPPRERPTDFAKYRGILGLEKVIK
jgi:hypothetical protein